MLMVNMMNRAHTMRVSSSFLVGATKVQAMASAKKSGEGLPVRARPPLRLVRQKTQAEEEEYKKLVAFFEVERATLLDLMANATEHTSFRKLRSMRDKWSAWRSKRVHRGFKERVQEYCDDLWGTTQIRINSIEYFRDKIYHDERWLDFVKLYKKGRWASLKETAKNPKKKHHKYAKRVLAKAKAKKAPKNHKYYEAHTKEARKQPEVAESHKTSNRESWRKAHDKELELRLERLKWVAEKERILRGDLLRAHEDGSDHPYTQKELDYFRSGVTKIKNLFGRSWNRNWKSFEETGQVYKQTRSAS